MEAENWLDGGSPIQTALRRGLAPGGNLVAELEALGDYRLESRRDALATCAALERFLTGPLPAESRRPSPLHALISVFLQVEGQGCDAFEALQEHGTPWLVRIVNEGRAPGSQHAEEDVLFALKVLAMYGTAAGAEAVIESACQPFAPEAYMWSVVLAAFSPGHPEALRVFATLASPLPDGFLAIALLDAANRFFLDGGDMRHPFDSDAGVVRLERWLAEAEPELTDHAISATVALPFLNHAARQRLLERAAAHPDPLVTLEAAWAAAMRDDERGIAALAERCLDLQHAATAREYLEALDRPDAVPPAARTPDFQARAEFAQWLAHPNELGRPPDEVEVVDQRDLRWPPRYTPQPFWLLRYRARATSELDEDDAGIGLVGSMTWCFFGYALEQRPPEDVYAIHCCWELEHDELIHLMEVDVDSTEYDVLLSHWSGAALESPRMELVGELDPELRQPLRLVAVAGAQLEGRAGWVVLDGDRSHWYPADELPREETARTVLRIHLGRNLLQLGHAANRQPWVQGDAVRPRQEIVAPYERLLGEFETAVAGKQPGLRRRYDELNTHFEAYLEARAARHGDRPETLLVSAYERLLDLARRAEPVLGDGALGPLSALSRQFEPYVDALIAAGRGPDAHALIQWFEPRWQHSRGYSQLGRAAWKLGDAPLAESLFNQLRAGLADWHRCDEMGLLAEIWIRRGRTAEASALLLGCLQRLREESREASGSNRASHEEWFQNQRRTFLRLFANGEDQLRAAGIPETVLRRV